MQTSVVKLNKQVKGIHVQRRFSEEEKRQARLHIEELQKQFSDKSYANKGAFLIKSLQDRVRVLEAELQKAREESFRSGYEEGKQRALQESERRIRNVREEMEAIQQQHRESIEQLQEPLLNVAKRMARHVLNKELQVRQDHDDIFYQRLRKLLNEVIEQHNVVVEVSPDRMNELDRDVISEQLRLPAKMELTFTANEDLNDTEMNVRSEDFYIDGSYQSQLNALEEQMLNRGA